MTAAFQPKGLKVRARRASLEPRPTHCRLQGYMASLDIPYFYLEEPIFDRAKSGQLQVRQ